MSEPLAPEQTHGQSFFGRFDPCLNAPFGIALAIILPAVGAILWCFRETLAWYWLLLGLLLILAGLWCLYAGFAQSYRRRLRLGKWPMAEPNSLEKIVALCKSDKTPIAVGEAWAYHTALRYAGPDENILALGAWWSKVVSIKADTMRVQSGILWGEVMRILWKENRAPMDRPSFDQMALGSSVRVAAHGFFVEGWFIDYLRALQAVETGSGKVIEVQRGDTNFWEVAFEPKYVITEVEFETQPNRLVRVEGKSQAATASTTQQEVDDYVAKEAAGWQDSPFMNMSVGGTAINRKWYTFDPVGEDNKDQNCFEYLRRLAWSGISGVDSLGDAQTIIQATPLIPFCFSRLCLELTNVELFTVQGFDWDKIALTLLKFHSQNSGRTDLRQRKRHGVVVTAFDAVVWPDELPGWFDMLYSLGIRSGTLHPGKYRTSETGKIEVIPHSSFWTQVS